MFENERYKYTFGTSDTVNLQDYAALNFANCPKIYYAFSFMPVCLVFLNVANFSE